VNDYVVAHLREEGVEIREVYTCPHQRSDGCACIKPNPFFLRKAERDHGVDVSRSFVVGDHPTDVELAANAGARGIYVLSGHGEKHRAEVRVPCAVVPGISEAVDRVAVERAARELRSGARGVPDRLLSFEPFPTQLNTFVRAALVTAATPGCLMRRSAEIA
jgi:hypothetical protein